MIIVGWANTKNKKSIVQNISEDEVILSAKNFDLHFVSELGAEMNFFEFEMVSPIKLKSKNIKIKNIDDSLYKVNINKIDKGTMPEFVYYAYSGVDWGKLTKLESNENKKGKDLKKYRNSLLSGYNEVRNQDIAPNSYYYSVTIQFETFANDINFDTLQIAKGKFKDDVKIGNIQLSMSQQKSQISENDNGFQLTTLVSNGVTITPNKNGIVQLDNITFQINKNVQLLDVKQLDKNENEVHVEVVTNEVDKEKTVALNEGGILLKEGEQGYLKVTLKDKSFLNKMDYASVVYLEILTKDASGMVSSSIYTALIQTKPTYQELVLKERDKVDFTNYYFAYLSAH